MEDGHRKEAGSRLAIAASAIASNLVPLVGVLVYGWSAATLVVLYWVETLLGGTTQVARIAAHRRLASDEAEHHRAHRSGFFGKAQGQTSFLRSYASFFYWFSIGHGIFLAAILEGVSRGKPEADGFLWGVDLAALARGAGAIAAIALVELGLAVVSMRGKPFSWLKARTDRSMKRVVVMHLAILGGAALVGLYETPTSLLVAVILVKTGFELVAARHAEDKGGLEP